MLCDIKEWLTNQINEELQEVGTITQCCHVKRLTTVDVLKNETGAHLLLAPVNHQTHDLDRPVRRSQVHGRGFIALSLIACVFT